jgi:flagellin-like protein
MQKKNMESCEDDKGVSPVIGVILMVAITVMMSAIVSSWSSGIKATTNPTTVGMDITRNSNNFSLVITSIDPVTSAPLPSLNVTYQYWNNYISGYETKTFSKENINVGDPIDIDTNNDTPKRVIITATYKDNSKKVLFSQEV